MSQEPKPEQWETVDEYKILISKKSKSPSVFRMAEIPWQTKVANAVQLIGKVGVPVKVITAKDGSVSTVTVLVRHTDADDLPQFWFVLLLLLLLLFVLVFLLVEVLNLWALVDCRIPVVFQGDLADAAVLVYQVE